MPWIKQNERKAFNKNIMPMTPGQVAYSAILGAFEYMKAAEAGDSVPSVWAIRSDAHKALIAAEREFYRLYIAPYEDQKIMDNGGLE